MKMDLSSPRLRGFNINRLNLENALQNACERKFLLPSHVDWMILKVCNFDEHIEQMAITY